MRKYKNGVQNENEQLTNIRLGYMSLVLGPITTVTVLGTIQYIVDSTVEYVNTLRTGDADLRFYITIVQDG